MNMGDKVDKAGNPLWDRELGEDEKLEWLLNELTLDEKLHMLASGSGGVERLGIPACFLGGEAAHGVEARNDQFRRSDLEYTTSFPEPIGMSSSWDREAIREAGSIVGKEARVIYNKKHAGGISRWAPTVDLLRDPRWGRNEEDYGEDPVQTGGMASAYVKGIQGEDRGRIMTAATLKHFYANNTEIGRGWKNSSISPRNKFELYIEPFRRCIEDGGAEGIMTSYNRINGVQGLLNDDVRTLLKDEFGLTHAVSDGGAMELSAAYSHATAMNSETVAASIKAGVDALSGWPDGVYAAALEAYEMGLLTEEDLDTAIRNVYRTKIRLGLFDGEDREASGQLCSREAHEACKRLTDSSIVLLKNDGILPIKDEEQGSCVLIGPVGDKWYQDWYGGAAPEKISLLEGLKESFVRSGHEGEIRYFDGCDRVALKSGDTYLALEEDGKIRLSGTRDVFVLEDWGEGSFTFRHETTGKYMITQLTGEATEGIVAAEEAEKVLRLITGRVCAESDRIFSWFDLEVFRMEEEGGDKTIIRDRFGNRLFADKDGYIVAAEAEATVDEKILTTLSFTVEKISCGIEEAVSAAAGAGKVILALGHNPMVNAKEEIDRATIGFIPYQQKLFDEIYKVNRNIAVVLMSDYPFAVNELDRNARAIVWSSTGSQCMGRSLADALTGRISPAGRLTQTWYRSDADLPDIDDYDIIGKNRTYRYFEGDVLYPFGYGLTYTTFEYGGLTVGICHDEKLKKENRGQKIFGQPSGVYDIINGDDRVLHIEMTVKNNGNIISDEVVQIYAKAPEGGMKKPLKQLIGFDRIKNIAPGESRNLSFDIPVRELALYDVISEKLIVEGGKYEIMAGPSSKDGECSALIDIDGPAVGRRDLSKRIKADHYDEQSGTQIVQGMYGFNALTAESFNVYEPRRDGRFSASYAHCSIPEQAKTLRIHGCAPGEATIRVFIDGAAVGSLTLNTRDYEKRPSQARNHMPRAAFAENMRRESWPLLWADIHIPLDTESAVDNTSECGHLLRIEVEGPFKYDWFMLV
ncbi:MAG: glycoside hydrolase family 3 C-terminal domain-containing protein [Lachnospiraceae bacterium]|nr:glycoside hydrolase family 3 C-terminal domain-containing protein [Lachnospiraceae bacterium]